MSKRTDVTQIRNPQFGTEYGLDRPILCPDNQAQLHTLTLARHQLPPESGFWTLAPQRTVNQGTRYFHKVSNRCLPHAYSPRLQMAPGPGCLLLQTLKSHSRHVSNAGWGRRLRGADLGQIRKKPRGAQWYFICAYRAISQVSINHCQPILPRYNFPKDEAVLYVAEKVSAAS